MPGLQKNWGYSGQSPEGSDPVPSSLDWNLWLGTAEKRPFKEKIYHPGNWRKLVDFGCGTLGDMGVHIFDTPYNALALDVPKRITNKCRKPTGFGYPENNKVTYIFPGTLNSQLRNWNGYGMMERISNSHDELRLPNKDKLPLQGAMFVGEKGRLLLPHFMELPKLIVNGTYQKIDIKYYDPNGDLGPDLNDYDRDAPKHYHQFINACLGTEEVSASFLLFCKID